MLMVSTSDDHLGRQLCERIFSPEDAQTTAISRSLTPFAAKFYAPKSKYTCAHNAVFVKGKVRFLAERHPAEETLIFYPPQRHKGHQEIRLKASFLVSLCLCGG
jgi:hypothetical protein